MSVPWPGWSDDLPPLFSGALADVVGLAGTAAGAAAVLGAGPLTTLLRHTAALAVSTIGGREVTLTVGQVRVRLTLEDLTVGDPPVLPGRLGEVRMSARDVVWETTRMRRVTVRGRNVRVEPGRGSAAVIAEPVLVDIDVAAEDVPRAHPLLRLAIDPAGLTTLHLTGLDVLALEIEPEHAADGSLTVAARALRIGRRRIRLPRRLVAPLSRTVPLDRLPPASG